MKDSKDATIQRVNRDRLYDTYECSFCGAWNIVPVYTKPEYCCNCGAKVVEKTMSKYRKKPVEVEAVQVVPTTPDCFDVNECPDWWRDAVVYGVVRRHPSYGGYDGFTIKTLEGYHLARVGDYIICGVKGELYPCKPDIFEQTYEKVQQGEDASKDGTSVKEIIAEWLRDNDYDGLCNPYGDCGCGLDDLMPCRCPNERGCVCAYEIPVPEDVDCDRFFCSSKSGVVNESN